MTAGSAPRTSKGRTCKNGMKERELQKYAVGGSAKVGGAGPGASRAA